MGYACPVCDVPQRDAEHLANHLAFTAMLHGDGDGDDHETWLDDNVPGWESQGPSDLAADVAEVASEADYDEVFEDTVSRQGGESLFEEGAHGHDHGHDHGPHSSGVGAGSGNASLDAEAETILQEARDLTRQMMGDDADDTDDESGDGKA